MKRSAGCSVWSASWPTLSGDVGCWSVDPEVHDTKQVAGQKACAT
jgi:hypothetical protein